jgi:capsid protein
MRQPPEPVTAIVPWTLRGELWAGRSNRREAIDKMIDAGAPAAAVRLVEKAPVGSFGTTDTDYKTALAAFAETMRTTSAFFRLLADRAFVSVPLNVRVGITRTPSQVVAGTVDEAKAKPMAPLGMLTFVLAPVKAAVLGAVTTELLDDISSEGQTHFANELKSAVAMAVDAKFLSLVSAGVTPITSAGATALNAKHDLRTALLQVGSDGPSRLYWVCASNVAKMASTLTDTAGLDAFSSVSASGGELAALPVVVSSAVPPGSLYLVNGAGIAAAANAIELRASRQASILMNTAPVMDSSTPTPATLVSMWQSNTVAYLAECQFGALPLRTDVCAVVQSINWGGP